MIARKNQNILAAVLLDNINILVDGIGGSAVPVDLINTLLRRKQIYEFVHLIIKKGPSGLNMFEQRMRLVLGNHPDLADPGIYAV